MPTDWQTLAVNQQPGGGTSYPFVDPSDDVRYLLGDLWLGIEASFKSPLKVSWLYGFAAGINSNPTTHSPAHALDLVISDLNQNIVFDSTTATLVRSAWGVNLETLCWTNPGGVLRVTRRTVRPPWAPVLMQNIYIVPANGLLDVRTFERLPRRVRSVRVESQRFSGGNISLLPGYNMNLTPVTATAVAGGGRFTNTITLRARPGDGLGSPSGCDDEGESGIRRINAAAPTANGDLTLDLTGCYRIQRPVAISSGDGPRQAVRPFSGGLQTIASHRLSDQGYSTSDADALAAASTFKLFNDCGPCCDCADFVNTYKALVLLDTKFRKIGKDAEHARDKLQSNIDRWNAQKACRENKPMRLLLKGEPNGILFVGGSWCNMTPNCATQVVMRVTFESFNDSTSNDSFQAGCAELRCRENVRAGSDTDYTETPFLPAGAWPVLDIHFDRVDPGGTSRFRMRPALCVNANQLDTSRVTVSVHPNSFIDPATGLTVPYTPVTLPGAVIARWTGAATLPPAIAYFQQSSPVGKLEGCGTC